MDKEFIVETSYEGYTFVGWAEGLFQPEATLEEPHPEKRPYYNMYVISPVSSFRSDEYRAFGLKAEKKKCISPDAWKDLKPGDKVKLFFDDKQRVVMAAIDG